MSLICLFSRLVALIEISSFLARLQPVGLFGYIVFEKKNNYSPLHAIYSIAHWLPTCAILQKTELRSMVVKAKQYLL